MTAKEAVLYHLSSVFPVLAGDLNVVFFPWKLIVFGFVAYLAIKDSRRFVWSGLFTLATAPAIVLLSESDPVSILVRIYLQWMCAEVTYRSLGIASEKRIYFWWLFPLILTFAL